MRQSFIYFETMCNIEENMRQFKCINIACKNIMYSDSNPKDICSRCADVISGDMGRDR